jgi:uncharacterized protein YjiS (DUF1127 family)
MTHFSGSMGGSAQAQSGWMARAIMESGIKAAHHFVTLMKQAAARERTRRELKELDAHMLRDIALEPFDAYFGWRGPRA